MDAQNLPVDPFWAEAFGMIAAAALPVLMGNLLGSCELPPECDGTQEEALSEVFPLAVSNSKNRMGPPTVACK